MGMKLAREDIEIALMLNKAHSIGVFDVRSDGLEYKKSCINVKLLKHVVKLLEQADVENVNVSVSISGLCLFFTEENSGFCISPVIFE